MSHSCRYQRHFSVPVWKHRWARSVLRLWPAQGLIVVFWPCSATLCANQVLCLPVLLWVSCSCVLSQRLCTMNKRSKNYLLSTSHADFSGLFLFCFECEWKVPSHVAQAELFCMAVLTREMSALEGSPCSEHEELEATAPFSSALWQRSCQCMPFVRDQFHFGSLRIVGPFSQQI